GVQTCALPILAWTIALSGIAVLLGLVMVNVFQPGAGVDPALAAQLLSEGAERAQAIVRDSTQQPKGMEMLLSIVPQNVIGAASNNANILALIDRKSTRLNSSHVKISYAVFCLKKKNKKSDK